MWSFVCLAKMCLLSFSSDASGCKPLRESKKHILKIYIVGPDIPKTHHASHVRRERFFVFKRVLTLIGTPDHPPFVFLPPQAFGAKCTAQGREEPHLAHGKDDSRAACRLHSLMLFRLPH